MLGEGFVEGSAHRLGGAGQEQPNGFRSGRACSKDRHRMIRCLSIFERVCAGEPRSREPEGCAPLGKRCVPGRSGVVVGEGRGELTVGVALGEKVVDLSFEVRLDRCCDGCCLGAWCYARYKNSATREQLTDWSGRNHRPRTRENQSDAFGRPWTSSKAPSRSSSSSSRERSAVSASRSRPPNNVDSARRKARGSITTDVRRDCETLGPMTPTAPQAPPPSVAPRTGPLVCVLLLGVNVRDLAGSPACRLWWR